MVGETDAGDDAQEVTEDATQEVLFELENRVATITLNRPESLNAINRAVGRGLMEGLQRIEDDPEIRAGIITGNGRAFCAGADLKERAQSGSGGGAAGSSVGGFINQAPGGGFATFRSTKPLIAAINGFCLAGGLELALICDVRICSPGATFGLPEITRGFFPGAGGPQRLPRAIPQALAMEMLLTGDRIDAEAALRAGLISRVVPGDELMPVARQIAGRIAEHAPLAVKAVKELAYSAQDLPLDQAMRFGSALRWIIGETDDAKEGPRAFAEKRDPEYRGQ
ncbi:MAG: enoyl-CoA hydratase/isomerase family protein [Dehalococcoidia bacterium]